MIIPVLSLSKTAQARLNQAFKTAVEKTAAKENGKFGFNSIIKDVQNATEYDHSSRSARIAHALGWDKKKKADYRDIANTMLTQLSNIFIHNQKYLEALSINIKEFNCDGKILYDANNASIQITKKDNTIYIAINDHTITIDQSLFSHLIATLEITDNNQSQKLIASSDYHKICSDNIKATIKCAYKQLIHEDTPTTIATLNENNIKDALSQCLKPDMPKDTWIQVKKRKNIEEHDDIDNTILVKKSIDLEGIISYQLLIKSSASLKKLDSITQKPIGIDSGANKNTERAVLLTLDVAFFVTDIQLLRTCNSFNSHKNYQDQSKVKSIRKDNDGHKLSNNRYTIKANKIISEEFEISGVEKRPLWQSIQYEVSAAIANNLPQSQIEMEDNASVEYVDNTAKISKSIMYTTDDGITFNEASKIFNELTCEQVQNIINNFIDKVIDLSVEIFEFNDDKKLPHDMKLQNVAFGFDLDDQLIINKLFDYQVFGYTNSPINILINTDNIPENQLSDFKSRFKRLFPLMHLKYELLMFISLFVDKNNKVDKKFKKSIIAKLTEIEIFANTKLTEIKNVADFRSYIKQFIKNDKLLYALYFSEAKINKITILDLYKQFKQLDINDNVPEGELVNFDTLPNNITLNEFLRSMGIKQNEITKMKIKEELQQLKINKNDMIIKANTIKDIHAKIRIAYQGLTHEVAPSTIATLTDKNIDDALNQCLKSDMLIGTWIQVKKHDDISNTILVKKSIDLKGIISYQLLIKSSASLKKLDLITQKPIGINSGSQKNVEDAVMVILNNQLSVTDVELLKTVNSINVPINHEIKQVKSLAPKDMTSSLWKVQGENRDPDNLYLNVTKTIVHTEVEQKNNMQIPLWHAVKYTVRKDDQDEEKTFVYTKNIGRSITSLVSKNNIEQSRFIEKLTKKQMLDLVDNIINQIIEFCKNNPTTFPQDLNVNNMGFSYDLEGNLIAKIFDCHQEAMSITPLYKEVTEALTEEQHMEIEDFKRLNPVVQCKYEFLNILNKLFTFNNHENEYEGIILHIADVMKLIELRDTLPVAIRNMLGKDLKIEKELNTIKQLIHNYAN